MKTVELNDAKRQLSTLVRAAQRGEAAIITRDGKPVAMIVPAERESTPPPDCEEDAAGASTPSDADAPNQPQSSEAKS